MWRADGRIPFSLFHFGFLAAALAGCSSAKKTEPELSRLEGRKVALVSIDGEATARRVVEAALINQLVKRGTFILVARQDVERSRARPEQDPMDWKGIARGAGAEYALRAKVLSFDAEERTGYSSETVVDETLAEERGDDGKTERLFKVKALDAKISVELEFTDLVTGDTRVGDATRTGRAEAEGREGAAHLPPRLRFLEDLANKAFQDFFERYN